MPTLQPVLVPCKGALADLYVIVDPRNPDHLQVYWGTAVIQVIPRDKNSLIFRIVVALLAKLRFKLSSLAELFGVSEKTLREWREALNSGDGNELAQIFHGAGAPKRLRPDVEAYVRGRYREAMLEGDGATPYGSRKRLLEEVNEYWGLATNEETLRQIFRDEDQKRATAATSGIGDSGTVEQEQKVLAPLINRSERMEEGGSLPTGEARGGHFDGGESAPRRKEPCAMAADLASLADETDNIPSVLSADRVSLPGSSLAAVRAETPGGEAAPSRQNREECGAMAANFPPTSAETSHIPSVLRRDWISRPIPSIAHPQVETPQIESVAAPPEWEEPCAMATNTVSSVAAAHERLRDSGLPGEPAVAESSACAATCLRANTHRQAADRSTAQSPVPPCHALPLLEGHAPCSPLISQHAGLLLLAPWFDQTVVDLPPIIRQTTAQILCGAVNQEQSQLMDYKGLESLLGKVIRDIDYQHVLLGQHTDWQSVG